MKKFITAIVLIITVMPLILKFEISTIPDCGIYSHGNSDELKNCSALLTGGNMFEQRYFTADEYIEKMRKVSEFFGTDSLDILYVTSTDKNFYNIRNTRYSFVVNKVLEGDSSLEGKDIDAEICDQTLFQELDDDGMERAKNLYNSKGFSEEEYSWLYSNREYCYSITNVPKTGDNYIIFVGEVHYSDEKEPLYLLIDTALFTEADVSGDKLLKNIMFDGDYASGNKTLKEEEIPIYKNYADNYTFFCKQEDFDWYVSMRNDLFKKYLGKNL